MASAEEYAAWIVQNADKRGTPEFDTVAQAYRVARAQTDAQQQQPKSPDANLGGTLQLGVPFTGLRYDTGIPLPSDWEAGIVGAGKTTQRLLQGINPFTNKADVAEENRLYQPLKDAHPKSTMAGEIAPFMAAGSIPAMVGMAAAEYGTPEERAQRAAFALGGGLVAKGAGALLGRSSMAPVAQGAEDFANYSNKWGIPTRLAQNTDSKPVQIVDAVLQNLPFSAGTMAKAKDATFQGFNRATSRTFGEDAAQLTPEVLGAAKSRIGQVFNDVSARNAMNVDDPLFAQLLRVSDRANYELVPEQANLVKGWVDKVWTDVGSDMKLPGTLYKAYDSKLGKLAKDAANSNNGALANVYGDLRESLRNAMDASISKADQQAWKTARKEYLNLKTVSDAVKNSPEGNISPSRLLQEVNSAQSNARFGAGNDLAELAQWAKVKLPDKIPTSGTSERTLYQKAISNPLAVLSAAGLGDYGLHKAGINLDPTNLAAGGLLSMALARGMAGKPASELAQNLLTRGGGLLGIGFAP